VASAIVSALHVLALALGLPSVFLRGRTLKGPLDADGFRRLFAADNVGGIAALIWIVTGVLRAFGGLEKGTQFYLSSRLFWVKMALFAAVLALEAWPMLTFIRWQGKPCPRGGGTRAPLAAPGPHAGRVTGSRLLRAQPPGDGPGGGDGLRRELHGPRLRAPVRVQTSGRGIGNVRTVTTSDTALPRRRSRSPVTG
jgi:uncharacterized membrane protein